MRLLCLLCREVTAVGEDEPELSVCPRCGSGHTPADADDTVTVTLTTHELRVLTIWASNWAQAIQDKPGCAHSSAVVQGILDYLGTYTAVALSMRQEIADLRARVGDVTVYRADGSVAEDM